MLFGDRIKQLKKSTSMTQDELVSVDYLLGTDGYFLQHAVNDYSSITHKQAQRVLNHNRNAAY